MGSPRAAFFIVEIPAEEAKVYALRKWGTNRFSEKEDRGDNNNLYKIRGTDPEYLQARLARDRPDILAELVGKVSYTKSKVIFRTIPRGYLQAVKRANYLSYMELYGIRVTLSSISSRYII